MNATGVLSKTGQDFANLFAAGNAAIVTGIVDSSGADIGSIFAAYSSGTHVATTGWETKSATLPETIFQPLGGALNAAISPANYTYRVTTYPNPVNASDILTCSPAGGTSPYSYVWSFVSNTGALTLSSATSQTCTLSKSFAKLQNGTYSCTIQCKVTDSASNTVTVQTTFAFQAVA